MITTEAKEEISQGWPVLLACLLGATTVQIHYLTIGLFVKPVSGELGWSVSNITVGVLIASVLAVPGAPFAGWLAQRVGLDKVILLGLPIFLAASAGIWAMTGSLVQWVIGWTLVALSSTLLKSNVWMLWTARNFSAARGVAFAIVMSGGAIFSIFLPYTVQLLIENIGWRLTFPVLALGMGLVAFPACYLAFRSSNPETFRTPQAVRKQNSGKQTTQSIDACLGMTIAQAIKLRHFWQILAISFLLGGGIVSLQILLVPMLQAKRLDAHSVALIAGAFGVSALTGRLLAGLLLDRLSARLIGALSMIAPAIGCLLYLYVPINAATALIIAIFLGMGVGAEGDVLGYITSRYFGTRSFGLIFGVMSAAIALGAGVGPFALGILRDYLGSYDAVMQILFMSLLAIVLLIVSLGKYPDHESRDASRRTVAAAAS